MQAPLLPGKRYAWVVRAQAREGTEEVSLFQNQGYSVVRSFTLQDNCAPPALVAATAERKRIKLSWQPLPQSMGYTLNYRLKDAPEWKEISTPDPQATLSGLQNGATYQYRVGNSCLGGQPVYGAIFSITLPMEDSARLAGPQPQQPAAHPRLKNRRGGDGQRLSRYPHAGVRQQGNL